MVWNKLPIPPVINEWLPWFLDTFRHRWRLQNDYIIFVECGQAYPGMPKVLRNDELPICRKFGVIVLIFFPQSQACKEAANGLSRLVRCGQACPGKCSEIASCQYLRREFSDCLSFLHRVRHWWKLLIAWFFVGYSQHVWACPKCSQTTNCQYLGKELSDCVKFLHAVRHTWKLQIDFVISVGCWHVHHGILKVLSGKSRMIVLVFCM